MKSKMSAKQVIRLAKKNFPDWNFIAIYVGKGKGRLRRFIRTAEGFCPIVAAANNSLSPSDYRKGGEYLELSDRLIDLIARAADDNCQADITCFQIRQRMLKELVEDNT